MKPVVQKVVVGGVILDNNKILIVQRSEDKEPFPNLWEVPGGKKEPFEKVTDAVIREVLEETGLKTKIIKIVDTFNFKVEREDEARDVTQINFLLKLVSNSEVKLNDEHQNFAWITQDELDNYNLSEETKRSLLRSFN